MFMESSTLHSNYEKKKLIYNLKPSHIPLGFKLRTMLLNPKVALVTFHLLVCWVQ
jgi:hypothetical protein